MNTAGPVGSLPCPSLGAISLQWFVNWPITLYLLVALFLTGTVAWSEINPHQSVFPAKKSPFPP